MINNYIHLTVDINYIKSQLSTGSKQFSQHTQISSLKVLIKQPLSWKN